LLENKTMTRNLFRLVPFLFVFAMLPNWLAAQQTSGTSRDTGATGGSNTGLSVEGPQIISGAEMRAAVDPGQVIGGTGAGAGFLRGAAEAGAPTARGTTGATGRQPTRGTSFNNFRNTMNNFGMFNSMYNRQRIVRVPISLGFSPAALPSSPQVAQRVQARLTRIPQLQDNGLITVEMDGRVAVLRGAVVSSDERELVARLVLLEPGIADVRNELLVAPAQATP
jgi:hypothetical protein